MQEFATRKTIAQWTDLRLLNCLFRKYRMAVRIMKLTAIILTVACLQLSANGITQTVTISVKDAPLFSVLKAIEKQTGFTFIVNSKLLQKAKPVSVTANNLPLQQVLDICFKEQPLTYRIIDKVISVFVKEVRSDKTSFTGPLPGVIDVSGKVMDESGSPLAGANVVEKGKQHGTTTNTDGVFVLKSVDENGSLEISYIGYQTLTVPINKRTTIAVAIRQSEASLQEVVINKGYYTETKRFSTGNVGIVAAKEIQNSPVNNPLLAIAGRVPGITVTQTTGLPGAGIVVQIQGMNSMRNLNYPLYVIDGVPYFSQNPGTTIGGSLGNGILGKSDPILGSQGNPLSYLNISDIESIEVLKDADATAIYGSRASNGAILITTKKGRAGQMKFDLNIQQGWGKVGHFLDLLSTKEYLEMRNEGKKNDNDPIGSRDYDLNGLWDTTRNTNWQDVLIGGTAKYSQYNASMSGGSAQIQYLFGGTYHRETTVFPGDFSYRSGSVHFSLNAASVNQRLKFQLSSNYMVNKSNLPGLDFTQYIFLAPVAPALYNNDGTLNWMPRSNGTSSWTNPFSPLYNLYESKTTSLISNAVLRYEILPRLEIKTNFGYTTLGSNEFTGNLINSIRPESRATYERNAAFSDNNAKSWIVEPQINYSVNFLKGKVNVLLGGSIQQQENQGTQILASGQPNDQSLKSISTATNLILFGEEMFNYKYTGYFSRLNYNWQDKYILNVTGRRDGSSRYGSRNMFHNFGSIGLAWIFTQEPLIQKALPFLNFGKLRGSYGTTGNDQIGDYKYLSLYNVTTPENPYQGITSLAPSGLTNPYIQWEETKKIQSGLDLGFLKDRINISVTYTRNRSSNQILSYNLPSITGFQGIVSNLPALLQNSSWEFSLNSKNIHSQHFNWSTYFNVTIPQNKLVKFPDLETSSYRSQYIIGKPIGILKMHQFYGVDQTTGQYYINDRNGKPTLSPSDSDLTKVASPFPKLYGGFQNTFQFYGFELDFLVQFVKQKGVDFLDQGTAFGLVPGVFSSGKGNQTRRVLGRWQKPGDKTDVERYSSKYSVWGYAGDLSYRDVSFIRLKNVSISYQLKSKWLNKGMVRNCKIYLNAQNVFTITNYHGLDPENTNVLALPPLRVVTAGLQIGF
jgi:TonB-dependent starch-binding outer membrane protein SusC